MVLPRKKILIKREQVELVDGRRRVISDFEKFCVDSSKDFHTKHGMIKKDDLLKKPGSRVACGKQEYVVFDADFIDLYKRIKRAAQIITLKDIGPIITNTGMNRNSRVIEAGVGSGGLTCFLAGIVKKVVSYDIDGRSLATARENVASFGFRNVTINEGNIYEPKAISEKGFDVMVLDVPEPWRAIDTAKKVLRIGGFLAVYVPHVMQAQEFVKSIPDEFLFENMIEVIEREWAVDAMRSRPATKDHSHTAFLVFVRRIG